MAKYFIDPFAVAGDQTVIPDEAQTDGSVSFEEGFTDDYEKILGENPDAKAIPRAKTNYLFFVLSQALQQYQQFGFPDFITSADNAGSAFPYSINAYVRYNAGSGYNIYRSLVNSNTALPTDTSKWVNITGGGASNSDVFIGEGKDYYGVAGSLPPDSNFLECDGSEIDRTTYAALFAVIGTTWGSGDGITTFNLPDSRRRVSVGAGGSGTSVLGNAVGNTGGEEAHTQLISEMPPHSHPPKSGFGDFHNDQAGGGAAYDSGSNNGRADATGETGGGDPFNIMQPSMVITKLIRFRIT